MLLFWSIKLVALVGALGMVPVWADYLDQHQILRDDSGEARRMNHYEAMNVDPQSNKAKGPDACQVNGARFPSVRDLAKMSQALGARGILELSEIADGIIPAGYGLISSIDPNGQRDEFYFSPEGYVQPLGDLGGYWFWSSSVSAAHSGSAFFLIGSDGSIGRYLRGYGNDLVRCVSSP